MKILHISNYYYPHIGGIEQVARDCVNALREGNEQRVFCFNHEKGDACSEIDGISVVRAGCFAKISSQSLSLHYGKLLRHEWESFLPDIVIFHYPNPFAALFLLRLVKKRCKLIVWWHLDITKQKLLGKLFVRQSKKLLERADKIIATSPNYIEGSVFLSAFRQKCVVVPCCANQRRIKTDKQDLEQADIIKERYQGKTILFAFGRHVPYKGLRYLLAASKLLGKKYAVLIGGEGPSTNSLKQMAEGDEKVVFLGKLTDEALKAYLLACDIFCFPSVTKNEAFGIALAEAMSFAKPSVTFTIQGSGVNYVSVNGETGIEAANGNAQAYAKAIETLAADPALRARYGEAAKKRAQKLFSEEAFREKVRTLIGEKGKDKMKVYGLIMAGGEGTRFWPLSRKKTPKQFLNLSGKEFVNAAIDRLSAVAHEIFVITNSAQEEKLKEIVCDRIPKRHILAEPAARNTAVCIGYAAVTLMKLYGDGIMIVAPSDSYIRNEEEYARVLKTAVHYAETTEKLVTVGIKPTFPATGYGYICFQNTDEPAKPVSNFIEKPNLERAQEYVAQGNYVWNSGVFVWKLSVILHKFEELLPDLYRSLLKIAETIGTDQEKETLYRLYPQLDSISVDYGILERTKDILVVPGEFGWNDVGSLDMIAALHEQDENANVVVGKALQLHSNDTIVYSPDKLVVTVGLENTIVVDTPDVTLVCPKDRAQDVKMIVEELRRRGWDEVL